MDARSTVKDLFFQIQTLKYLILSIHKISLPDNKSGVGSPYHKGPIIIHLLLVELKLIPKMLPILSQTFNIFCKSITEADTKIKSSAFIKQPKYTPLSKIYILYPKTLDAQAYYLHKH